MWRCEQVSVASSAVIEHIIRTGELTTYKTVSGTAVEQKWKRQFFLWNVCFEIQWTNEWMNKWKSIFSVHPDIYLFQADVKFLINASVETNEKDCNVKSHMAYHEVVTMMKMRSIIMKNMKKNKNVRAKCIRTRMRICRKIRICIRKFLYFQLLRSFTGVSCYSPLALFINIYTRLLS